MALLLLIFGPNLIILFLTGGNHKYKYTIHKYKYTIHTKANQFISECNDKILSEIELRVT